MCGRYDLSDSPAAIRAKFSVPAVPEFAPNADLRPTQMAPVVRLDRAGERACELMRWGLVPVWADSLAFGARCINARSETAATLPAFRDAFRKRRCLVPVNAFYEWSGPKGQKTKWRIGVDGEPLFALAGLWSAWRDRAAGEDAPWIATYTIVTRAAGPSIAPIHDRMPVVLRPEHYAQWLDPAADAQPLLAHPDEPAFRIVPA